MINFFEKVLNFFGLQRITDDEVKIQTALTQEVEYNKKNITNITYTASNKLANYAVADSNAFITGDTKRIEFLNERLTAFWGDIKPFTSRVLGTAEKIVLPCVTNKKIIFCEVAKSHVYPLQNDGEKWTDILILSRSTEIDKKIYEEWRRMRVENNVHYTEFIYNNDGDLSLEPYAQTGWEKPNSEVIFNCDRLLLGRFVCPVDPRTGNKFDSASISDGTQDLLIEYIECRRQLEQEFEKKQYNKGIPFSRIAKDKNGNPIVDHGKDWVYFNGDNVDVKEFDPQFREQSLLARKKDLEEEIEKRLCLSKGIFSNAENSGQYTNQANIKRAVYDTYVMVQEIRRKLQQGIDDLIYSTNVLAEKYSLTPAQGKEEIIVEYSWSNSMIEVPNEEFAQLSEMVSLGEKPKGTLTAWFDNIPLEQAQEQLQEIVGEDNVY